MATASNLEEFQAVFENCGSTLWTNSTYTDKDGNAFYIDSSSVPNLSDDTLAVIENKIENDQLFANLFFSGLVMLDGSTSRDDWVEEGSCSGRVPYAKRPKLARQDFVQNSNSSHWAANPAEFLTGYSALFGPEESPLNARTRMGLTMLQSPTDAGFGETAPAGDDGKFNAQELLQVIWNNRAFNAEFFLPEIRDRCELVADTPIQTENLEARSVAEACNVLQNWSGNYNADAVGAHIFRVLVVQVSSRDDLDLSVEFDATDPVNTPAGLISENKGTATDPVMQSLLSTMNLLEQAGIPLTATLGSVQTYTPTGGVPPGGMPIPLADALPWHGGDGNIDGAFNAIGVVNSDVQDDTVLPRLSPPLQPGTGGLAMEAGVGWRIGRGTSWHFGLQFNDDGPEAWGLLSYGQSTNPALPWYTEQSIAYSNKEPRRILFKEAEVAAAVLPGYDNVVSIKLQQGTE